MQQRNLYFRACVRRQNVLKSFVLDAFLRLASWPRLVLEVFIRRNMGERYFSLASSVTVAVLLFLAPMIAHKAASYGGGPRASFWVHYGTWYLFLFAFLYCAWMRWLEVRRKPSVFNFERLSLYAGDILAGFERVKVAGKTQSVRTIETLIEPAVFFVPGVLLLLIDQPIGVLLMMCSIVYAVSYCAAYKKGDDFVMDKIDEIIMNEEMTNVFVDDMGSKNCRGVRFYMKRPSIKALRRKVADAFNQDDTHDQNNSQTLAA